MNANEKAAYIRHAAKQLHPGCTDPGCVEMIAALKSGATAIEALASDPVRAALAVPGVAEILRVASVGIMAESPSHAYLVLSDDQRAALRVLADAAKESSNG